MWLNYFVCVNLIPISISLVWKQSDIFTDSSDCSVVTLKSLVKLLLSDHEFNVRIYLPRFTMLFDKRMISSHFSCTTTILNKPSTWSLHCVLYSSSISGLSSEGKPFPYLSLWSELYLCLTQNESIETPAFTDVTNIISFCFFTNFQTSFFFLCYNNTALKPRVNTLHHDVFVLQEVWWATSASAFDKVEENISTPSQCKQPKNQNQCRKLKEKHLD